jgi:hypothetical protein
MNWMPVITMTVLALVSATAGADPVQQAVIKGANNYKQVDDSCDPINTEEDGGKHCAICQAYLKALNALNEPVQCDIPTNPQFGFYPVEWKKLDPWADPKLLYAMDTFQRPHTWVNLPGKEERTFYKDISYEDWLWAYKKEMTNPRPEQSVVKPVLVEAVLDLYGNNKLTTVLGYTPWPQVCKQVIAGGGIYQGGAYFLFIRSDNPPGFDVQAAKNRGEARKLTLMSYGDRIYAGWSDWGGIITRESDVRLFGLWGEPVSTTMYCHYEAYLSLEVLEELEEKTHDHNQ